MSFMTILRRSSFGESVLFLAWKTSNSKYSIEIPKRFFGSSVIKVIQQWASARYRWSVTAENVY